MATVNSGNVPAERILTIGDFVARVYLPWTEEHKRPSTATGYRDIWEDHLEPLCARVWLKDARTYHVQGWLNQIGTGKLSRNTLKHVKSVVSGIFPSESIAFIFSTRRTRVSSFLASEYQTTNSFLLLNDRLFVVCRLQQRGSQVQAGNLGLARVACLPSWPGDEPYRLAVPDKVIQAVLRHANLTTTMNIYVKSVAQDSVKAMQSLEA
jgi:hypothetical protein